MSAAVDSGIGISKSSLEAHVLLEYSSTNSYFDAVGNWSSLFLEENKIEKAQKDISEIGP